MIGYQELLEHRPAALPKPDHDAWFEDHGYDINDLLRVGRELADYKLNGIPNGTNLTQDDLTLALISAFLFGVEITIRCERGETSGA